MIQKSSTVSILVTLSLQPRAWFVTTNFTGYFISRLSVGKRNGGGSFTKLVPIDPYFHRHVSMLPVLVFLIESLSSGQMISSISKEAFTSLFSTITTDVESEQTPLLTNKLTLFVLDAEATIDEVEDRTAGKLLMFDF